MKQVKQFSEVWLYIKNRIHSFFTWHDNISPSLSLLHRYAGFFPFFVHIDANRKQITACGKKLTSWWQTLCRAWLYVYTLMAFLVYSKKKLPSILHDVKIKLKQISFYNNSISSYTLPTICFMLTNYYYTVHITLFLLYSSYYILPIILILYCPYYTLHYIIHSILYSSYYILLYFSYYVFIIILFILCSPYYILCFILFILYSTYYTLLIIFFISYSCYYISPIILLIW